MKFRVSGKLHTQLIEAAEAIAREMGANEEQVRTIKEMFQALNDV
jgi:hypothetical protein